MTIGQCLNCGAALHPRSLVGGRAIEYCGGACRTAAHRARRRGEPLPYDSGPRTGVHGDVVYYAQSGELVKIGTTRNVSARLACLRKGDYPLPEGYPSGPLALLAVEPGANALEQARHREFAGCRIDGTEWFRGAPALMDHIRAIWSVPPTRLPSGGQRVGGALEGTGRTHSATVSVIRTAGAWHPGFHTRARFQPRGWKHPHPAPAHDAGHTRWRYSVR